MKAISLWQPWASLWLSPAKIHETRHWPTHHRGWLLVHAAKRPIDPWTPSPLSDIVAKHFGPRWELELPRGALIGRVLLTACLPTDVMPAGHAATDDYQCGNFEPGRFGWKRAPEFEVFLEPIPYRGMQAIFNVPDEFQGQHLARHASLFA